MSLDMGITLCARMREKLENGHTLWKIIMPRHHFCKFIMPWLHRFTIRIALAQIALKVLNLVPYLDI